MEYKFDACKVRDELVEWIRNWFEENGKGCNAVIGISGGKDSTVMAALCSRALGKDRVIGVLMPNGTQYDISDSYDVVNTLGINYMEVNINDAYNGVIKGIKDCFKDGKTNMKEFELANQTIFNLPPRLRMSTVYAISQSNNGRVMNTCNLSETLIGWETRWGDAVGDVAPFANLTATEVIAIAHVLDLPQHLADKVPSDGLCGKTDEDSFGFKYSVLDHYVRTGEIDDPELKKVIDNKIKNNWFKHSPMPFYEFGETKYNLD